MKRNNVTKLLVVLSFLVLLTAAAGSVVAHPDYTAECGSCHTNTGTLTLTTNSTVNAETGDPFLLQIQAGNGAEYVAIKSGWVDNDYFQISESLIQDNSVNDTNSAVGEITVEVTFTPLINGTYTLRIWTASTGLLGESFDVVVTVTGEPSGSVTTPPPPVDLVGIWKMMMYTVPAATALILVVFGYFALRRKK